MTGQQKNGFKPAWALKFSWKHKWTLLIAGIIGAFILFTGSLFIPAKYEASAIVYAAGNNPNNPMTLSEGNPLILMQILESSELKDSLINKFDLAGHYNISKDGKNWRQEVYGRLNSNIDFKRTVYKSIQIRVLDHDPEMAADMANAIVGINNQIINNIVKENTINNLKALQKDFLKKQKEVSILTDELSLLQSGQVDSTISVLTKRLHDKKSQISNFRDELKQIREKLGVHALSQQLDEVQKLLTKTESQLELESGKLKTYREKLPLYDSIRIKSEARFNGLQLKKAHLDSQLQNLMTVNARYDELNNKLALEIYTRDLIVNRIEVLQNSFEPGVETIELNKRKTELKTEIEQLGDYKKAYENARNQFEKYSQASYVVSRAQPNYNKTHPNTLLFMLGGFVLSIFLAFFLLLAYEKYQSVTTDD